MVVNELRDGAEKVLLSQVILALRCGTHNIMAYHPLRFPEEVDAESATWEQGSKGPKKWSEMSFEFKWQRMWEEHFIKELLVGHPCPLSPGPWNSNTYPVDLANTDTVYFPALLESLTMKPPSFPWNDEKAADRQEEVVLTPGSHLPKPERKYYRSLDFTAKFHVWAAASLLLTVKSIIGTP